MPHVEIPQAEFKVVILGDSHIGKTSLVTRFAEGYYRENSRPATIGAHFKTKRITSSNNTPTKIQIWDTAGAKEFHAMAPMFYKNAAAIIICYDVTCRQSFEGMRIWLDEVRRKVKIDEDVVVAIAALKTDLLHDNNGTNRIEPAVPEYEVEQLAEALGVIYLPTSAKTDMNVNALFQCVSDRVLHHRSTNNNNNNMNTFGGGGYGSNNHDILINRDDLNSSPIPNNTQPRTRDQYDKYYKKNSETSQESSQMNGHDESINSMTNSRVRTNSGGSGIGKQSNDSTPGRVPTPNSDGTTSINNVGDDSIIASPSPGKKRRGKYDKDTSPNKNKGIEKGLCPGGTECADENLYTCSPMTCGVGSTGDGSSSGCTVQ